MSFWVLKSRQKQRNVESPQNATSDAAHEKVSGLTLKEGSAILLEAAVSHIKAIKTPKDKSFPRLDCPVPSGRSSDGTFEVLTLLSDEMERIGTKYSLLTSDINPTEDRQRQPTNTSPGKAP